MMAYLAGSIEFAEDLGKGWRRQLKVFLQEELGHRVYDPAEYEKKNLSDEESANFRSWKTSAFKRYRNAVRKIIDFDLDLIEQRIDYVICHWQINSNLGGGTAAELTYAYRKRIPVYLVTELPLDQVSGWVLSCADQIFPDFESLKAFLLTADHKPILETSRRARA